MTKIDSTPNAATLSPAKLRLLEKYLHGNVSKTTADAARIARRTVKTPAPLAPVQEEVWRRECEAGNVPPFYNESITVHRHGRLNADVLGRSLTEIIRRHEAWRTSYDVIESRPVQVIHPPPTAFPVPVVDLRNLRAEDRAAEALRVATEQARMPFDLKTGPLVRAKLATIADDDHRLFVTMHQSVVDGVTVNNVFPSELVTIYEALAAGKPSPLSDLSLQYSDYAYWHQEWLQGDAAALQLTYWKDRLQALPRPLAWPAGRQPDRARTYRGIIRPFSIPYGLTQQLKALCRDQGVTLFMGLTAGCSAVLARYSGQEDFVLGTLAPSGRKRAELQNLVGYFLNPVPLRMDFSGNPSARELLRRTRETVSGAIANDDVPMEHLMSKLGLTSDSRHQALFDVVISLAPELTSLTSGWTQTFMDVESGGSRWPLYLELREGPEGLMGRAQYNPDMFTDVDVAQLIGAWQTLLEVIVREPDTRLSDYPVEAHER
ncbi:MAG TPA: condensation domain-containing protein [Verrucomicrobiae bacterium]|nr:condensation domain-containing protein [Verrucomicrobiae bacterium]